MTEEENQPRKRAVIIETRSSFAVVRINLPAERNSLSVATIQELDTAVCALIKQKALRTIIFTGTDDVFASGANIRQLATLSQVAAREFAMLGQGLFQKIADAPQLTIAAINGYCMGGGLDLALSCDVRCASSSAVFAHPGASLGIITGWGGTQRLPRLIGTARALEMFATAKRVKALEAFEIGLVSRMGEPVLDCAIEMALAHASQTPATS